MNIVRIIIGFIAIVLGVLAFLFLHDGELWIINWVFPILAIGSGLIIVLWGFIPLLKKSKMRVQKYAGS